MADCPTRTFRAIKLFHIIHEKQGNLNSCVSTIHQFVGHHLQLKEWLHTLTRACHKPSLHCRCLHLELITGLEWVNSSDLPLSYGEKPFKHSYYQAVSWILIPGLTAWWCARVPRRQRDCAHDLAYSQKRWSYAVLFALLLYFGNYVIPWIPHLFSLLLLIKCLVLCVVV